MNTDVPRLQAAIEVSSRSADRLRSSLSEDRRLIERGYGDAPGADALRALDAFVQRFQQLHEHMASRLYPAIFRAAELGEKPPVQRNLFTWLERHLLIDSGRAWFERTEIRNRLVHEYPLDADDRTAAIRLAVEHASAMLDDLIRALAYIDAAKLLGDSNDA